MWTAARRRAPGLAPGNARTRKLANGIISISILDSSFGNEHEGENR